MDVFEEEKQKSKAQSANVGKITAKEFFNDVPSTSKLTLDKLKELPTELNMEILPKASLENKTELEIKVIESMHKKINEKKDLFRAIFCDSESEEESVKDEKVKFVDNFLSEKPASEINVLRNTSPPRGLFKNFLAEPIAPIREENKQTVTENIDEFYGPKLPERLPSNLDPISGELSDLDRKILEKLEKTKKSSEKWVEKETLKRKKHDKHKKHKKEKKAKKHKSRH